MKEYFPVLYQNKKKLIDTYLVLGEEYCVPENYDHLDITLNKYAKKQMENISHNGFRNYTVWNEQNRELLNSFKYYKNPKNKKIFLYAEIFSKTKTRVIVNLVLPKGAKLWINEKCVCINYDRFFPNNIVTYLDKGKNIFILEQYSPNETSILSIQLLNYTYETSNQPFTLSRVGAFVNYSGLLLIPGKNYFPTESKYGFMYMANDESLYKKEFRIDISDSSKKGFAKTLYARINEIVEIDIDELRDLDNEILRHEKVRCTFTKKNNEAIVLESYLLLNDFSKRKNEIIQQVKILADKSNQFIATQVYGRIQRIEQSDKSSNDGAYWLVWQLEEIFKQLEAGTYSYDFYKNSGIQEVYAYSNLDGGYIWMALNIPENYNKSERYPLFVTLAMGQYSLDSFYIQPEKLNEPVIHIDVTGRGAMGGSYIGEASIFEILDWVKLNFTIDNERIYILGCSNSGYAAWAIAQNYPHLAAAIYPQIGYPYVKNIKNIANVPTYELVSPKDHIFKGRENEIKKRIGKFGNYHQYDFTEMMHCHFGIFLLEPFILNQMLQYKQNPFPDEIIYRTERNRHLESFWIKLHGIKRNKNHAEIKAKIVSETFIKINITNSDGVSITLPPKINTAKFVVNINSKNIELKNQEKNKLHLVREKEGWKAVENVSATVDFRKGTGLLDIYLNNLRIIIPDKPTEAVTNTAHAFANPHSNGFDPVAYVDYPIYKECALPDHIFGNNLIVFDVNGNNRFLQRYKDKLYITTDSTGFEHRGNRFDGNYVLMQIIPSPYDHRLSLLAVQTNYDDLLLKHILLRKVIIPTYCNGRHEYWNNEILAFINGKYYAAYESQSDLKLIENRNMK